MDELLPKPSIDSEQEGINFPLSALLKQRGQKKGGLFFAKLLNKSIPFLQIAAQVLRFYLDKKIELNLTSR